MLLGKHLTLALKYSMFQLSWSLWKENVAQYTFLVMVGFHSQSVLGPLLGCGDSFCRVFTSVLHKWHRVLVILYWHLSQLTYLSEVKTSNLPLALCCFKLMYSCHTICQMFVFYLTLLQFSCSQCNDTLMLWTHTLIEPWTVSLLLTNRAMFPQCVSLFNTAGMIRD